MLGTLTLFSVTSIEVKRVYYGPDNARRSTIDLVLGLQDGSKLHISTFGVIDTSLDSGRRLPEVILNLNTEDRKPEEVLQ